ncbi:uncharacterized protein LAESUDRAFT_733408 [Laetiporus sulphureus 93-53]|uniref:arginyltransferase n=1 Tax=Laetiporus sulphureus 93-53 TaxID=1314785 RepID=A0A165IAM3_9APHY|nr:uncharacterized protein LAESUDRAFT_733408 [Laetiporus sulphureus 93-53]KZT12812.1 hypothetical protein LAESUDRAFT_733408 [Laetiporus sulphureus 93-53]
MSILTIIAPLTPSNSTCGYCGPPGERSKEETSWHQAECIPLQMSCKMVDRGWRRSGTYCYKPDLKRSCCPAYTIKLDALTFKESRSQRKLVNRWNRFVMNGNVVDDHEQQQRLSKKGKSMDKFFLPKAIHSSERTFCSDETSKHQFEVTLEPSSYTEEKFALYQNYQKEIHHEDEKAPSSFRRFLVETPLHREPIHYSGTRPDHLPGEYGSYHQLYRLDGELIAMGVIDILPHCVSSVYFMYRKEWEKFSLGKLSALREATLAREIHDAGVGNMRYLYMGFYIHSCQKMRYKGDYAPSYLLDPEEYTWFPLETCRPLLDSYRYVSFAHPEHHLEEPPTDIDDPVIVPNVPDVVLNNVDLMTGVRDGRAITVPVMESQAWRKLGSRRALLTCVNGLGAELATEPDLLLYLAYET